MNEARTIRRILIQIAVVISLVETAIHFLFQIIPHTLSAPADAALDASLLVVAATPIIYVWVIRPFILARDEAAHLAQRDHLTLVSNRLYLLDHLEKCFGDCSRRGIYAALLYIDLDGFKRVNDDYGHAAGDALLVEVADRMRSVVRREDKIFRLGGDEFMVITCPFEGSAEAAVEMSKAMASKIQATLRKPVMYDGRELNVDSSIGIRLVDGAKRDLTAVIQQADAAMYHAKVAGGGRIVVFEE